MSKKSDTLEEIDNYFAGKSEAEKWMYILIVAGLIGYLIYTYLYPYAHSKYEASVVRKNSLLKKLKEDEVYLQSITYNGNRNYYIEQANRDIANRKATIKEYKEKIAMLEDSFQKLSEVLFNKQNWAKFLDSITQRADKNGVDIIKIKNKYVDSNRSFGHVLEVEISCSGGFQGILAFINDLEQNKLVTDVYDANISSDTNTSSILANLKVSVWGVNR